jgi:hypothetical protein
MIFQIKSQKVFERYFAEEGKAIIKKNGPRAKFSKKKEKYFTESQILTQYRLIFCCGKYKGQKGQLFSISIAFAQGLAARLTKKRRIIWE